MTIKLDINCSKEFCNPSVLSSCRFVTRHCGLADQPYCMLFNDDLLGDYVDCGDHSYKKFKRCKSCLVAEQPALGYN